MRQRRELLLLLFTVGFSSALHAQVSVAPTVVMLGDRTPYATFVVVNASTDSQEVSIDFKFGYPAGDSIGAVTMLYGDSLSGAAHSIQQNVRAFPKQFRLAPMQQQIVRMTARLPQTAAEGTYWTRIVTSSGAMTPPPKAAADGQIAARLNFRLEQVTTLLYRHGEVKTGLELNNLHLVKQPEPGLLVALHLTGNSPFLGGSHLRVLGSDGKALGDQVEYFAVYVDMLKRFALPNGIPAGNYTCELSISFDRPDLSPQQLLRTEAIVRQIPCTIP